MGKPKWLIEVRAFQDQSLSIGTLGIHVLGLSDLHLKDLKKVSRGAGLSYTNNDRCTWVLGSIGEDLVGFCCLMEMPRGRVRYKSDYVVPKYRNLGVYNRLCDVRDRVAISLGAVEATCYSSRLSRGSFLRRGFTVVSNEESNAAYMRKEL